MFIAIIENEKDEKQEFKGKTPSAAAELLCKGLTLEGKVFYLTLANKRFLRKRIDFGFGFFESKDLFHELIDFFKVAKIIEENRESFRC